MFEKKVQSITISLDNPTGVFLPGQTVSGKVKVVVENELTFKEMMMRLEGYAKVYWTETRSTGKATYTVPYKNQEYYMDQHNSLVPMNSDGNTLRPGTYEYPFSFKLREGLPTSYESKTGQVRYILHASISRPWAFDTKTSALITVIAPFDLNTNPESKLSTEETGFKTLCCGCCKSSPITGRIQVGRKGYVPGETIVVEGEVSNGTRTRMKEVKVRLVQIVDYRATTKTRRESFTATEVDLGSLAPNSPVLLHGSRLLVPPLPPSGLLGCKIIDINYYAQIFVNPRRCSVALRVNAPLIIGTIPLQTGVEQDHAPPPSRTTSFAPSIFGAADLSGLYEKKATKDAVAPEPEIPAFTPSYSYYKWD